MVTLRPTTRTAALLALFAVVLGLGELWPPLVALALVLDGVLALLWMADVVAGGSLGFSARRAS